MIAKPNQINALIPQIKSDFQGALVFGPEIGIVQELSEKIGKIITSDNTDSFNIIKITPPKLKEEKSFLLDEGNAPAFLGGRKLIILKDADQTVAESVESYFQNIKTDSFLLISAGNLTKNSDLRLFCETNPKVIVFACYPENEKVVSNYIRDYLRENQKQAKPDALNELVNRLSGNRLQVKQELNKLINYLNDKNIIEMQDVLAVVTDTQEVSKDTFCQMVAIGDQAGSEKEYKILLENGENPVSIIRILFNYFNKLLENVELVEQVGIEAAMKKILKPYQFHLESGVRQQLKIWKKEYIIKVLTLLIQSEQQSKITAMPAELLLERVIIQISNVAKRNM